MPITLGAVQLRIMRILWDEGEATARHITDVLTQSAPIAHSTVQTLLRKLEAKRAVTHFQKDRSFMFRAIIAEKDVTRSAAQDMLNRVFQGSISGLVAHLLESEEVSGEEMARLRKLVDERAKEAGQ